MNINDIKNSIEQAKGRKQSIERQITTVKEKIKDELRRKKASEQARTVIQSTAKSIQSKIEYKISELATLSLLSIMEKDWKVLIEFQEKRGRTEPQILLQIDDGFTASPKNSFGGGVKDILGQFMRFGLFGLIRPKLRPFFALDEPLKWLKGDGMPEKGAEAIHEISHKLDLQILLISHSPELIAGADKVIKINEGE